MGHTLINVFCRGGQNIRTTKVGHQNLFNKVQFKHTLGLGRTEMCAFRAADDPSPPHSSPDLALYYSLGACALAFPWFTHTSWFSQENACINELHVIDYSAMDYAKINIILILSTWKWPTDKMAWINLFSPLLLLIWPRRKLHIHLRRTRDKRLFSLASARHWKTSETPFQPYNNGPAGYFAPNIDLSIRVPVT